MVFDMLVEQLPDHVLDFADTGVAKFKHLPAIEADQVVVLPETVAFFIDRLPCPELMALDKIAFHEQVQGIVHCGTAHAIILVFHLNVEGLHIKMVGSVVNLLQNGKALRCLTLSAFVQVGREDSFHFLDP